MEVGDARPVESHPYVEAHPEEEGERASQEGQPRAQAQHGSQLLTRRAFQIRGISLCEDPQAWSAIGFEVTSHTPTDAATRVRLGNTTVVLTGKGVGFEGWTVDGITESIDGITSLGPALDEPARSEATHPNGITAIDHVVVGTGDIGRTSAALDGAGLRCRRERSTTAYGSHMRQRFYWLGDVILELNRQSIPNFTTFQRLAEPLRSTDLALLLINRQGSLLYIPIQSE